MSYPHLYAHQMDLFMYMQACMCILVSFFSAWRGITLDSCVNRDKSRDLNCKIDNWSFSEWLTGPFY